MMLKQGWSRHENTSNIIQGVFLVYEFSARENTKEGNEVKTLFIKMLHYLRTLQTIQYRCPLRHSLSRPLHQCLHFASCCRSKIQVYPLMSLVQILSPLHFLLSEPALPLSNICQVFSTGSKTWTCQNLQIFRYTNFVCTCAFMPIFSNCNILKTFKFI